MQIYAKFDSLNGVWLFGDGDNAEYYKSEGFELREVEKLNGQYYIPGDPAIAEARLAEAKAVRAEAVDKIVVTVDGMQFDANEQAQSRMARSLAGAMALGLDLDATTTQWVLADNSIATVSARQLAQALQLAGAAQTELWVVPYEDN